MKKRIIWLSLALAGGQASHAFAQSASDALRYSRLQFGGPARTQGIGGANVALGADFGNLTSNPAGLGMFQKSEIHFAPGIGLGQSNARLDGNAAGALNETQNSFHIGSAGLVLTTRHPDNDQSTSWRGGAFALGFTRLADFNASSRYGGTLTNQTVNGRTLAGDDQSYLASLRGTAGQGYFDDLRAQGKSGNYTTADGLAYGAYLTSILKARRTGADSAIVTRQRRGPIGQTEYVTSRGSVSQFDLGYGASYRDRLYLGVGLGLVSSNYTSVREFTETETDPTTHLNSYTLRDETKTTGSGFNARLGLIYRATDALRVGASVQTPTFMRLSDTKNSRITTDFSAQGTDVVSPSLPTGPVGITSVESVPNDYAYTLTTPFRANGGVAYTLGKHGFVTGDVEYVGYGQARLHNDSQSANGDNYSFTTENSDIQTRYQNTLNLRFGAEGRFDVFRARLGYARYGDPYKADTNNERAQNFYTAGLGLRQGNFFLDGALVYTTFDQVYTPYTLGNNLQPVIKVNNNRYTTSLTAGLTF
ncbi:MAG: TonB-dependent receptor [Hymenobacter sp.]